MPAFVLFEAASQPFAVPATDVLQVLRMAAPAAVPGGPRWLRGVVNLHGRLIPVVDVRVRLGHEPRPLRPEQQLLVVRAGARVVALEVERVLEVREVSPDAIDPAAAWGSQLVAGAVTLPDGAVLIQAVDEWLSKEPASALGATPEVAP